MGKANPKIVLVARNSDGDVVRKRELSPADWYDRKVSIIDDPHEIARLGIRVIDGVHFGANGKELQTWTNTYGPDGEMLDMVYSNNWDPLVDAPTPPPAPGNSAYDQLVRLGILRPIQKKRPNEPGAQVDE